MDEMFLVREMQLGVLAKIFRPAAPVDDLQLLIGRMDQLTDLTQAAQEPGRNAIVFGERGVGKTSVSNMALRLFEEMSPANLSVRIPCSADDDFSSIWLKLAPRIKRKADEHPELSDRLMAVQDKIDEIFFDELTPDSVARALSVVERSFSFLVVVDEFDRLVDQESKRAFADLVKMVSDDYASGTIVMVGVADTVGELLSEHASIDRALRQVHVPRMTDHELREIVQTGFSAFQERTQYSLEISKKAVGVIANLSQGFPYYAHLLSGAVGRGAVVSESSRIDVNAVVRALVIATDEADPGIRDAYQLATDAARSHATFRETLMACAMTPGDHIGFFAAADISPHLSTIVGSTKKQARYNSHLTRFSQDHPRILERRQVSGRYRYRFLNPLMKPFVLMNGFKTGLLDPSYSE